MAHSFGGKWTKEKLEKVGNYLQTYVTALKNQKFKLIYVDAFAGTGYINLIGNNESQLTLPEFEEIEVREFVSGSARNALEVKPAFDEYVFIEKNETRFSELEKLKSDFPNLTNKISPITAEANEYLQSFAAVIGAIKEPLYFLTLTECR